MYRRRNKKYKTLSVPIKKEITEINKKGNKTVEIKSYKIKFINTMRFMASSISNLVDNLTEGIHKIKCKNWVCFPEYKSVKGNLIIYKRLPWKKCYSKKLNEKLKEKFKNTFQFSNNDIKNVYPNEYIDYWERFNEITRKKKHFIAT